MVLVKRGNKRQINILSNAKIGFKDGISKNAKLLLSESSELTDESGNAGFFILDEGYSKAVHVRLHYWEHEAEMRIRDYELGFRLSADYDASARDGALMVMDRKAGEYELTMPDGETLAAKIPLKRHSSCFMLPSGIGVIADSDRLFVIGDGKRHLIEITELNRKNGSKLTDPLLGTGNFDGMEWLAIKDRKWEKECILIALEGSEKFCYKFQSLKPFGWSKGVEGPRK